ncbi:hypothetical protein [uncultured Sunxiuqinia sp.]|uniref:hypothetical protein n=1 Tax=uncultured Sunxiuqinia sp. TaxID=1573825 RepID=UPI002AA954B6|nr:hypothetical protein [uncultured Sunxiuqinia sp.]
MNKFKFSYLNNKNINRKKWEMRIEQSSNSSIYARCWFLDIVCPDWYALVWGEYEYIMPLPVFKKFGVTYLSQPIYSQQIAIYPPPPQNIINEMQEWISHHFKYIHLSLSPESTTKISDFIVEERKNFILPLNSPIEKIENRYHPETRRNVRKANQAISVVKSIAPSELLNLKKRYPGVEDENAQAILTKIILKALWLNKGVIYGAYTSKNELCGAAFFLFDTKRVYYMNSVSSEIGKKHRAMYAIIHQFYRDNCEQNLLFDFEGSQNPGIAHFFKRFGSEIEIYQHIHKNKLPWPLRLMKK